MKRCPACGKVIPRGHGYKSDRKYCSYKCYQNMAPKMVEIQEELGKPIKEVILENLNSNNNITVTAELLGTNRQQLYSWMDKLGIQKTVYWK